MNSGAIRFVVGLLITAAAAGTDQDSVITVAVAVLGLAIMAWGARAINQRGSQRGSQR